MLSLGKQVRVENMYTYMSEINEYIHFINMRKSFPSQAENLYVVSESSRSSPEQVGSVWCGKVGSVWPGLR